MDISLGLTLYYICAIGSGIFWLLTYIAVIWRGFQDKTFSMPVVALSANASWEAIFSFVYTPPSLLLQYSSIAWLTFDLPILYQCFLYGANDFKAPFIKENFRFLLSLSILVSFSILLSLIVDFKDFRGVYSGFGINFMMSILYINLFIRRDGILGQSLYIALFKWLGTLFAFLSLFFPFPLSDISDMSSMTLQDFWIDTLLDQNYPLTPLIESLYFFIFIFDIAYNVFVYRRCQVLNLNPWLRF